MVRIILDQNRCSLAMSVQHVEGGYEEFVSILLLVTRQMSRVRPYQVEQLVESQGCLTARVELLKEVRHLANQATGWLRTVMPISEEVIAQQRGMYQRLYDAVHKTGAPKIDQSPQTDGGVLYDAPPAGMFPQ